MVFGKSAYIEWMNERMNEWRMVGWMGAVVRGKLKIPSI